MAPRFELLCVLLALLAPAALQGCGNDGTEEMATVAASMMDVGTTPTPKSCADLFEDVRVMVVDKWDSCNDTVPCYCPSMAEFKAGCPPSMAADFDALEMPQFDRNHIGPFTYELFVGEGDANCGKCGELFFQIAHARNQAFLHHGDYPDHFGDTCPLLDQFMEECPEDDFPYLEVCAVGGLLDFERCPKKHVHTKDSFFRIINADCKLPSFDCWQLLSDGFLVHLNEQGVTDHSCSGWHNFTHHCTAEEFDEMAAIAEICTEDVGSVEPCPADKLHTKQSYIELNEQLCSHCSKTLLMFIYAFEANGHYTNHEICDAEWNRFITECTDEDFLIMAEDMNLCQKETFGGPCPKKQLMTKEAYIEPIEVLCTPCYLTLLPGFLIPLAENDHVPTDAICGEWEHFMTDCTDAAFEEMALDMQICTTDSLECHPDDLHDKASYVADMPMCNTCYMKHVQVVITGPDNCKAIMDFDANCSAGTGVGQFNEFEIRGGTMQCTKDWALIEDDEDCPPNEVITRVSYIRNMCGGDPVPLCPMAYWKYCECGDGFCNATAGEDHILCDEDCDAPASGSGSGYGFGQLL
jgi:hypothetical protein